MFLRYITRAALIALLLMALIAACALGEQVRCPHCGEWFEPVEYKEGFTLAAENDALQLLVDEVTLETQIVDKRSGAVFSTKIMDGARGNAATRNNQKSDFRVYYIVHKFLLTTNTMDSNSMSIAHGNYKIHYLQGGFEIEYEIGDMALTVDDLPKMIPIEKYNEKLLPYWTTKNDNSFREFYRVVQNKMWVRTDDGTMGKMKLNSLHNLIYNVGVYTKADLTEDNAEYGYEIEKYNPRIYVKIRFQLDGDDLLVTVPCGEIAYTDDNPLTRLDILPYFMTATTEDEGYIFVPDGSGALINLNNNKTMALSYTDTVYGSDPLKNVNRYSAASDVVNFPIYGIKTRDTATLAIIEKGAELATLFADISGRSDEFNRVYSYFTIRDIELLNVVGDSNATTPRYPDDVYMGDIVLRYKFLSGERASALGMANAYREYLIEREMLKVAPPEEDAPIFIELVSAVRKPKFFLGVPYQSTVALTTLDNARAVYDALMEVGAKNIILMPSGVFEGGVWHESLNHTSIERAVGNKRALKSLYEYVAQTGGKLYPAANIARVYTTDDFSKNSQAARRQDNYIASVLNYSEAILSLQRGNNDSYYVSPRYIAEYALNVVKGMDKLDMSGLMITDLAGLLVPDYRRDEHISRVHATDANIQALQVLADSKSLILNDPNDYALAFADYVTGLSSSDNGYKVLDAAVPFAQWVLEGSCAYTTTPWNENAYNGVRKQFLYAIESKSAPYFRLTYEDETEFINTEVDEATGYFMTNYHDWLSQIGEAYSEYAQFWQRVKGARAVDYAVLTPTLRKIVYDNGVSVYVNYGIYDARADGLTIPAEGYIIAEGGVE